MRYIIAAAPAMAPPMTNVSRMTRSRLTPMSAAASGSWATARMPRPRRDRCTNWSRTTIMTMAEPGQWLVSQAHGLRQHERGADGRDQGDQGRGVALAQGPVGHVLEHECD